MAVVLTTRGSQGNSSTDRGAQRCERSGSLRSEGRFDSAVPKYWEAQGLRGIVRGVRFDCML
jgi:hypothetical protein